MANILDKKKIEFLYFLEFEKLGNEFRPRRDEFIKNYFSLDEVLEVVNKAINYYKGSVDIHLMRMDMRPNPPKLFHRIMTYYAADWSKSRNR